MTATEETMTRAAFAVRHGKSKMTVSRWEQRGLLLIVAAGRVDVAVSEARMRGAGVESDALTESTGPGGAVDPDAPELTSFLENLAAGDWATQAEADRVKANALAGLRVLEWRQKAGELIELAAAQSTFFECARAYRDALMSWPSQEGPLIAADLEIADSGKVARVLDDHIRKFLVSQGEPDASALHAH